MKKTSVDIGDLIVYRYPDKNDIVGIVIGKADYQDRVFDIEWYENGIIDNGRYDEETLLIWMNAGA